MAAAHSNVTLGAAAVRLGPTDPSLDVPLRQVLLSASGADAFVGATAAVTNTDYGIQVDSTALGPVSIGPFETGPIKLSQLWAAGAGATLHILAIPF